MNDEHSGIREMEQREMDAMADEHDRFWKGLCFGLLFAAVTLLAIAAMLYAVFNHR